MKLDQQNLNKGNTSSNKLINEQESNVSCNKLNNSVKNSSKESNYNAQSNTRMKDFISYPVNPDNNAFFTERSNHLSSKGD